MVGRFSTAEKGHFWKILGTNGLMNNTIDRASFYTDTFFEEINLLVTYNGHRVWNLRFWSRFDNLLKRLTGNCLEWAGL